MARYRITAPDGGTYEITAPDDATEEQVMEFARSQIGSSQPQQPQGQQREATGTIPALLEGVGQGLTFGFSDELEGAIRGGVDALTSGRSFGEAYDERLAGARERQKAARETNPVAFYGGEIGSAIAMPFGAARAGAAAARALPNAITAPVASAGRALGFGQMAANAGAGLGARTIAGAREGAAYGGLFGLGTGEGVEGRAENALVGAGAGGLFGAAVPAAVDVGSAVVRGVTNPIRAALNPQQMGREKYAEALLRDRMPTGMEPSETGNVLEQHVNRLMRVRQDKPGMMSMDLGGENVRNLVRSAANMPSTGAQRLNRRLDVRQGNQWSRIEKDLTEALGDPSTYGQSVDDLAARIDEIGNQAIAPALQKETPMTPELQRVLQRPTMRDLLQRVERKLMDEDQPIGLMTRTQALHRVKVELDEAIGQAKRAERMGNTPTAGFDARTLTILKRDLLNAIPNREYKAALKQYASQAQVLNAAEDGFDDALKLPVEEVTKKLRSLGTEAERKMYRLGAARALAGRIRQGNVTRDRTEGVFSSPDIQMRLKAIFPDRKSLREFQRRLVMEARMADSRKAVQGNSTTAKQLAQAEEAGQPIRAVAAIGQATTGRLTPVLEFLSRQAQRFHGMTPEVANSVIRAAMEQGAFRNVAAWERAIARAEREPQVRAQLVERLISGFGAGVTEPTPRTALTGAP